MKHSFAIGVLSLASVADGSGFGSMMSMKAPSNSTVKVAGGVGGGEMQREFTKYNSLPLGDTELLAAGWTRHGTHCDQYFGFAWTKDPSGATRKEPLVLYTTAGGQPAGVGTLIRGSDYDMLPEAVYRYQTFTPGVEPASSRENAYLTIAFREGDIMCSGRRDWNLIGDTMILSPRDPNVQFRLPLFEEEAKADGWYRGSCFDSMGTHWFYDTARGTGVPKYETMLPVVTMFHEGKLNAIFFAIGKEQVTIPMISTNHWEPTSLDSSGMCMNTCNKKDCDMPTPTGQWATMHIYFQDAKTVKCDQSVSECTMTWPIVAQCCPKSVMQSGNGIGQGVLQRVYTQYNDLPMGAEQLKKQRWVKQSYMCDPAIGFAWTKSSSGASRREPLTLYTTAGGQPSGVGTIIRGRSNNMLPESQQKFATANPDHGPAPSSEVLHVDIAFRQGSILCDGSVDANEIGDTLIVNPKGPNKMVLPITESEAVTKGWFAGSCFDSMGKHYFLDTSGGAGVPAYDNMFPVVTMFHEGVINAIFFATGVSQVTIPFLSANNWEPSTLSRDSMCMNTCDNSCDMVTPSGAWSTMHIYFSNAKEVKCAEQVCKANIPGIGRGGCCAQGANVESAVGHSSESHATQVKWAMPVALGGAVLSGATLLGMFLAKRSSLQPSSNVPSDVQLS